MEKDKNPSPQLRRSFVSDDTVRAYKARYAKYFEDVFSGAIAVNGDISFEATRAALSDIGTPMSLSPWAGWDQSRLPWSEAKHKDAVCYAAFGETWAMEDADTLISFIERTWPRSADVGIPISPGVGSSSALSAMEVSRYINEFKEFVAITAPKLNWSVWQDLGSDMSMYSGGFDGWQHGFGSTAFEPRPLAQLIPEMKAALSVAASKGTKS